MGPFAEGGLYEALCLAVCTRRVGAGEAMLDVLLMQQLAEAPVLVAGVVVGEHRRMEKPIGCNGREP